MNIDSGAEGSGGCAGAGALQHIRHKGAGHCRRSMARAWAPRSPRRRPRRRGATRLAGCPDGAHGQRLLAGLARSVGVSNKNIAGHHGRRRSPSLFLMERARSSPWASRKSYIGRRRYGLLAGRAWVYAEELNADALWNGVHYYLEWIRTRLMDVEVG